MAHEILIPKQWTKQEYLQAHEAGGKKRNRVAGGWIADLAAQKKVITLCPLCTNKFNPARVNYRKEKDYPVCSATCDGCSAWDTRCSMYVYAEIYSQVRMTRDEQRAWNKAREARIRRGNLNDY